MPADPDRDPLEELAADYADRLRRGERPDLAEYQARHPALAQQIASVFPTIASLEGLRAPAAAAPPTHLGEFRILHELGRGGMGVVYVAEQASLRRQVAVKVLGRSVLPDQRARARFQREARICASLTHPGIIPIHAIGEDHGLPWFAMQLVEGVGLDRVVRALATGGIGSDGIAGLAGRLHRGEQIPRVPQPIRTRDGYRQAALLVAQAADALHYAHGRGVLHRDIKPANVIVDADGRLWIADFGLAKAIGDEDLTLTSTVTGTLLYLAPERFDGITTVRSDIYSLGLVLFELATWQCPFPMETRSQLLKAILYTGIPDPISCDAHLPRRLADILARACARDPAERHADAAALARDLRAFAGAGRSVLASCRRLWPHGRRQRRWGVAIVIVVLAMLVLLGLWLAQPSVREPIPVAIPQPQPQPQAPAQSQEPRSPFDPGLQPEPLHRPIDDRRFLPPPRDGGPRPPPGEPWDPPPRDRRPYPPPRP